MEYLTRQQMTRDDRKIWEWAVRGWKSALSYKCTLYTPFGKRWWMQDKINLCGHGNCRTTRPVCSLLQAQSVCYELQHINPSKKKKNHSSARFWFLSNSCPPDRESDKKSVFIFFQQLKADHTSKICRDCPRNCVKYSSITGSSWSGNDSAVNIFSSHLLMYKLFSVGIFSAHIKHTVMSDCLCSKVITIGIMEHLSANNQKTLNVMSSLLEPFSNPVQGYMNIETVCFLKVEDLWESHTECYTTWESIN